MIPFYDSNERPVRPLGMVMNQNRLAVPIWSYAMEIYPPVQIIELGSYNGAMAIQLGIHAAQIGAVVLSVDTAECPSEHWKRFAAQLPVVFLKEDIFTNLDFYRTRLLWPRVTYVLCDNGDKIREFNTFAPMLKSGDVIAAHDYVADTKYWHCSEIIKADVADTVEKCGLEPFMQEHMDLAGWLAYKKR